MSDRQDVWYRQEIEGLRTELAAAIKERDQANNRMLDERQRAWDATAKLKDMTQKALDNAFRAQALDDKTRIVEREALFRAANICRTYAHKDQKHSQTRRQVAYACQRRIEEAAREITVDAVNERMENLTQELSDGQRSSPQPGARPS